MFDTAGVAAGLGMPPSSDDGELRPSLVRAYSDSTVACYEDRLNHYQRWCKRTRNQTGINFINDKTVLAYVQDQINRWTGPDSNADDYRRIRPETIKQAINALVYWGERAGGPAPDDRPAKELLRRFTAKFNAEHAPAWQVTGRKSPRPRRPRVPRPQPAQQTTLFDLEMSA